MSDTAVIATIAGLAGLLLLLIGMVFSYREGKRIGSLSRSDRFNRLASSLSLGGSEWGVSFDDFESGEQHSSWIRFRQFDTRVIGEGEDAEGRRCSAEGVVMQDKLCYIFLDRGRSDQLLGTVMVDMNDAGDLMTGMRCSWSVDQGAVALSAIRLQRFYPGQSMTGTEDVDSSGMNPEVDRRLENATPPRPVS